MPRAQSAHLPPYLQGGVGLVADPHQPPPGPPGIALETRRGLWAGGRFLVVLLAGPTYYYPVTTPTTEEMTMTAHHWPPGRPAWIGATCLVPRIDEHGSHRCRTVAEYDHRTGTSRCPECGAVVAWSAEPSQWADPRCVGCQSADCPPTLRTGAAL